MLGDNVRYDAEVKHYPDLVEFLIEHFELISVCPEVEIGLSVPRPPVKLVQTSTSSIPDEIKMVGRDDPSIEVTQAMRNFCQQRPPQLDSIHGYIFKSKSPSCGIKNVPLFNEQGVESGLTRGVFVSAILQFYPLLPITDESGLQTNQQFENFLQQVINYKNHPDHA